MHNTIISLPLSQVTPPLPNTPLLILHTPNHKLRRASIQRRIRPERIPMNTIRRAMMARVEEAVRSFFRTAAEVSWIGAGVEVAEFILGWNALASLTGVVDVAGAGATSLITAAAARRLGA